MLSFQYFYDLSSIFFWTIFPIIKKLAGERPQIYPTAINHDITFFFAIS